MKIKVMSYNIHKGRSFFFRSKTWQKLQDLLYFVEPDIVFLQEFLRGPEAEILLEMMADEMWPHHSFGQNASAGDYKYGNVIISKFPLSVTKNFNITNHRLEKRGLLYGKVEPLPGVDLHLFCTHLDLREPGRKKQVSKISKEFEELISKDSRLLLAGDFNDWNGKLNPVVCEALQVEEAFVKSTGKFGVSSPSVMPLFSLDRVYFRGLQVVSTAVVSDKALKRGSDHLPLVAEFELK